MKMPMKTPDNTSRNLRVLSTLSHLDDPYTENRLYNAYEKAESLKAISDQGVRFDIVVLFFGILAAIVLLAGTIGTDILWQKYFFGSLFAALSFTIIYCSIKIRRIRTNR